MEGVNEIYVSGSGNPTGMLLEGACDVVMTHGSNTVISVNGQSVN